MTEVDKKREATASIRGYLYQLDATLIEILKAGMDDEITIEGIEDFDRYSNEGVTYNQVKYYEAQSLTDSVLRDPLQKLFAHYFGLSPDERVGRKYVLYGHFKEIKIALDTLTVERFKEVMAYITIAEDKTRMKKSHLDGLAVSDQEILSFCEAFRIEPAKEFSAHRREVIDGLIRDQKVSDLEVEGFHYPRAFDFIATLATKVDHRDRTTSRKALRDCLKGTQVVHFRWLHRERDAAAYAKYMRNLFFLTKNTAGIVRAFVIEVDDTTSSAEVSNQLREIATKWSSADKKSMPNGERFAPFAVLRNASVEFLASVKDELFETGLLFVDGYPFRGSSFKPDHALSPQTRERPIALRIVDSPEELAEALAGVGKNLCHFYDFFLKKPCELALPGAKSRMFSIPIESVSTITKII